MVDPDFILPGGLRFLHFICVRDAGCLSDTDLLHLFGLANYQPTQSPRRHGCYVLLAGDGEWKIVADDYFYTLCNMSSTRQAIHQLGQTFDVFAAWVGDADYSFDFVYYRDGRVERRYVVDDPSWGGGGAVEVENTGDPLPGEEAAFRETDDLRIAFALAASLGIRTSYTAQEIRAYVPPGSPRGEQNPS